MKEGYTNMPTVVTLGDTVTVETPCADSIIIAPVSANVFAQGRKVAFETTKDAEHMFAPDGDGNACQVAHQTSYGAADVSTNVFVNGKGVARQDDILTVEVATAGSTVDTVDETQVTTVFANG